MLLRVIAVGQRMPQWVDEGVDEFSRRMPPELRIEWRTVKAEARHTGGTAQQWKDREAQRILEALPAQARLVLLDERGKDLDSQGLAGQLARWQEESRAVAIVIGGPDGVDDRIRSRADTCVRLSSLTLPHALVRVVLAEQLYRAWSILAGHPYHRE
ncbi:MAG: 23S rRNA (pseudouridine(1915)-N(3))-methyltransferase RlmH [Burkholderiaceae bacterium]